MNTIRRLIYREIISTVLFVTLSFAALFFFFDFVDELQNIGRHGSTYQLKHAFYFVMLMLPTHFYELLPISVLIGSIFVMARFAQSSEFTILRTSGLSPMTALKLLATVGMGFVVLTFILGDYVSPISDRYGQLLKARYTGQITIGQTGAWLRERNKSSNYAVNVAQLSADGQPEGIKIFEFGADGQWLSMMEAPQAVISDHDSWLLQKVEKNSVIRNGETSFFKRDHFDQVEWATNINSEMISVALLNPERMNTVDLFEYIQHLEANGQSSQRFEIEFWRKLFYPISCLVMISLALPFGYLHFRSGNITSHVFMGVLAGISFFLLNNVFGYVGNLNNWSPWVAAATPGLLYSALSLGAFTWLVLRR
jgi:lipopolysaccharide export system permease protein